MQTLSLKLQSEVIQNIKEKAHELGFKSINSFFTDLFQKKDDLISEDELLADIKQAQKEYKEGKTIKADSLEETLCIYDSQQNNIFS